jgi:hypothetical protein
MKLSANKKSWHFRLASYGGLSEYADQTDLCSYFWAGVRGVALSCFLAVLGSLIGFFVVVAPGIQIVAWCLGVPLDWYAPAIGGYIVWCGAAIIAFAHFYGRGAKTLIVSTPAAKLVGAGYRGWKEKTCVLIDVK